jgi:hypothetical protein
MVVIQANEGGNYEACASCARGYRGESGQVVCVPCNGTTLTCTRDINTTYDDSHDTLREMIDLFHKCESEDHIFYSVRNLDVHTIGASQLRTVHIFSQATGGICCIFTITMHSPCTIC